VQNVRDRLLRSTAALNAAGVPYAVAGGNAVALWVSTIDEAAVRNTRDVDILIRRADFDTVKAALESAGFVHRHVKSIDAFLDGPDASVRDAVHIVFANETIKEGEPAPSPDVSESEVAEHFRVLSLDALVRIKLTAFRDKDRTHLRDMIELRLIGQETLSELPRALADRLQELLDDPDG